MGVFWAILAPIIALVITTAATQAAVLVADSVRRRDYLQFENKTAQSIAQRFPLSTIEPADAEERRQSLSRFVDEAQARANEFQTIYHNTVVRSAGCLVLAFISLAFGTLQLAEARPWAALLLNCVDVIAILCVLVLFFYGRWASRPWIVARASAELLRQYQYLSVVFPSAFSPPEPGDLKTQYDSEAKRIANSVQSGPITGIVAGIENFWSQRKTLIVNHDPTEADLTADALLVYLRRRVRRQLGWFTDSKLRLVHIAERRKVVLLGLYVVTASLAAFKLIVFLDASSSQAYVSRLVLLVTGLSAAMTAYYINQNARSLIHRYNTQSRFISGWLVAFNQHWKFDGLSSQTFDVGAKTAIRSEILRFEDLMIEELIDWTNITSHDTIELAP